MPTQNDLQQWLQALLTCIDNKDTDKFSSFLGDDIQFRFGNMPVTHGKASTTEQVRYFFDSIKSLKHTMKEYWSQGDSIICHGIVTYTRHDDSTLAVPFSNIFKTNQNSIFEYLIFADVSDLYKTDSTKVQA